MMKTAKEIHEALDGIRDNTNPGLLVTAIPATAIPDNNPLSPIATILAVLTAISLIQARTLALMLEKIEEANAK